MRTAKTLIRLGGCPGWSESSLGAHATLLVLSWSGSNVVIYRCIFVKHRYMRYLMMSWLLLCSFPTWISKGKLKGHERLVVRIQILAFSHEKTCSSTETEQWYAQSVCRRSQKYTPDVHVHMRPVSCTSHGNLASSDKTLLTYRRHLCW